MIVCFVGKGIWLIVEKSIQEHGVVGPEQDSFEDVKEESRDDAESLGDKPKPKAKKAKRKSKPETKYGMQPYQYVHPEEPGKVLTVFSDTASDCVAHEGRVSRTLFFMMPSSSGRVTSHTVRSLSPNFHSVSQRPSVNRKLTRSNYTKNYKGI